MNLKHTALLAALFSGACMSTPAPISASQEATLKIEIEAAFEQLVDATKAGDHAAYFSYFDRDVFTALGADGATVSSFDAFKRIYEPQLGAVAGYKFLEFDPVHIRILDSENAVLVNAYSAELVLTSGDIVSASGAGAQVWSKRTGEWKLVHVSDAQKR